MYKNLIITLENQPPIFCLPLPFLSCRIVRLFIHFGRKGIDAIKIFVFNLKTKTVLLELIKEMILYVLPYVKCAAEIFC